MHHSHQISGETGSWIDRTLPPDSDWAPVQGAEYLAGPVYIPRSHLASRRITKWDLIFGSAAFLFTILWFGRYIL